MKYFFPYLKEYKGKLSACLVFMFLFALASSFSLSLLSPFLNALFYEKSFFGESSQSLLLKFNNWFLQGSKLQALVKIQMLLIVIFLLKGIFGYVHKYLGAVIEEGIMKKIRDKIYAHLHILSLDYFHGEKAGVIISRITNDVSQVKNAIKDGALAFLRQSLLVLGYFCFALYLSWKLLLVSIIIFPLFTLLLAKLTKRLRARSNKMQEDMGKITSTINETLGGIKIVKAFSMEAFEIGKFLKATRDYFKSALRFERTSLIGIPFSELISVLGACILLSWGGYQVLVLKSLSADRFFVFLGCAIAMLQALQDMPKINARFQQGVQAMIRVNETLNIKPTVKELANPSPLSFNKEITFNDVRFTYDTNVGTNSIRASSRNEIIQGITLKIQKGETVALVGPSGGGKTTLTDLLIRFYDPISGSIEIDGIDIRNCSLKELRNLIGVVTQEPVLFNDTMFNNIAYGGNDKPENVYNSAKLANAHEFIDKLPDGYNTIIGERGAKLSGGERQRLAIARALNKNPQILIFDEATAHLDSETEAKVHSALQKLLEGRTAIVIAHRLSTVQNIKRIIVITQGTIIEEGSHEELLKKEGLYSNLVQKNLIKI